MNSTETRENITKIGFLFCFGLQQRAEQALDVEMSLDERFSSKGCWQRETDQNNLMMMIKFYENPKKSMRKKKQHRYLGIRLDSE